MVDQNKHNFLISTILVCPCWLNQAISVSQFWWSWTDCNPFRSRDGAIGVQGHSNNQSLRMIRFVHYPATWNPWMASFDSLSLGDCRVWSIHLFGNHRSSWVHASSLRMTESVSITLECVSHPKPRRPIQGWQLNEKHWWWVLFAVFRREEVKIEGGKAGRVSVNRALRNGKSRNVHKSRTQPRKIHIKNSRPLRNAESQWDIDVRSLFV